MNSNTIPQHKIKMTENFLGCLDTEYKGKLILVQKELWAVQFTDFSGSAKNGTKEYFAAYVEGDFSNPSLADSAKDAINGAKSGIDEVEAGVPF